MKDTTTTETTFWENKPEKRDIQMSHIKERKGGEIKALLYSATYIMWAGADLPSVLHFSEYIMRR